VFECGGGGAWFYLLISQISVDVVICEEMSFIGLTDLIKYLTVTQHRESIILCKKVVCYSTFFTFLCL
jgi:hypothetical protein